MIRTTLATISALRRQAVGAEARGAGANAVGSQPAVREGRQQLSHFADGAHATGRATIREFRCGGDTV